MGKSGVVPGQTTGGLPDLGLDDPNLSQEDKDLRLAIALQQQENAQVLENAKRRKAAANKSNFFRTGRSGVNTRLAHVRDKDHGAYSVPSAYGGAASTAANAYKSMEDAYAPPGTGPTGNAQQDADLKLAKDLQSVEATSISAAVESDKLAKLVAEETAASEHRTQRSGKQSFNKKHLP